MSMTPYINRTAVPVGIRTMVKSPAFSLGLPPFAAAERYLINHMAECNESLTTADLKNLFPWPSRIYTTMWVMPRLERKGLVARTRGHMSLTPVGRTVARLTVRRADISVRSLAYLSMFAAYGEMSGRQFLTAAVSVFGRSRFGSQTTSRLAGPGSVYSYLLVMETNEQLLSFRTTGNVGQHIRIYDLSTLGRYVYESWLPALEAYEV